MNKHATVAREDERVVVGRHLEVNSLLSVVAVIQASHVVYADARGPLCAYWNHRDAHRSKVTADSRSIVFFADELDLAGERGEAALDELGTFLKSAFGDVRLGHLATDVKGT